MTASGAEPWHAEVQVDEARAAALIAAHLPALAGLAVTRIDAGWDNTVFRVGDGWAARFPRRAAAAPLMEAECLALPDLAPQLPLSVPVPEHVARETGDHPWTFAAYRWLAGVPASEIVLDASTRRAHVTALAGFLAALHAVPVEHQPFASLRAAPDEQDAAPRRVATVRAALAEAIERGWLERTSAYEALIAWAAEPVEPELAVLCHGDLDVRHVLVRDGVPAAVIDWGDVHRGPRGVDLALAASYLEREDWPAFLEAYGGCSDDQWRRARFSALFKALAVLRYAILDGRRGYERTARATLERLRE